MKLTQKTIFQCFDRSRKPSPGLADDDDEDIIECEPDIQPQRVTPKRPSDFLVPIHIRQEHVSSANAILPLLNQWKLIECNDSISANHLPDFDRICPTTTDEQLPVSDIQFVKISSNDRQMELFRQYINDDLSSYAQSAINWQNVFHNLQEYRRNAVEQNQYEQLLWTEIYRPRHSTGYLGHHTKPIRRLNEWFAFWSRKLRNEQPKRTRRQGRKRRRDQDDDEDFIDQLYHHRCQSKQEHPQIIFIHGCGTTSLVHALAEEHHFKVTEINGSQSRARAPLLKQLEQVTSHHYLSIKRCPSDTVIGPEKSHSSVPAKKRVKNERGTIMTFFPEKKTKKKSDRSDTSKENESRRHRSKSTATTRRSQNEESTIPVDPNLISTVQVEKASLILFDEIETLTIDDHFWSCLKKLLETAKKPIILTSNSRSNPDGALVNLTKIGSYELIHLETTEPELIYCFLRLILLVEMLEIPSLDQLTTLYQSCSCDLRRSLLNLQFLAQSSFRSTSFNIPRSTPSRSDLLSSQTFDSLYYSHLAESWTPSILQTHFDDLTRTFNSKYEQSHLLLAKHSEQNCQRIELSNTFKIFMREQNIDTISNCSALYLDYRPYVRRICQNEQTRAAESNSTRRLRHCLGFRGCALQWSDYAILSDGLN